MNRQRHRIVFSRHLGTLVAVAECARAQGKAASGARAAGTLAAALLIAAPLGAQQLPVPSAGGALPAFVTAGQAAYQAIANQAFVNQVGNKAILNWKSFNVGAGHSVQFRQVQDLVSNQLVPGASFTTLNRIWDINPSVIAGAIGQAAGQKANIILVNSNGIAFMGGSQVNLNSFTASTLNMADQFVDNLLTSNTLTPQFQLALDGGEARGFVKVFEGARISAGQFGRVMLIAPTVVNRGSVSAPDGQVVMAAASKLYLRSASGVDSNVSGLLVEVDSPAALNGYEQANTSVKNGEIDGQAVALVNPADDLLGHVTNLGSLSADRGNVTMIGYAVNQKGLASASSSVVQNGSVYLLARDRAVSSSEPTRGGRVVIGAGSRTEVRIDTESGATAQDGENGDRLEKPSVVKVVGQDVRLESGSRIVAPSGTVDITAQDNPGAVGANDPFTRPGSSYVSNTARLHIAEGAVIDVSGLQGVAVDVARNSVAVELRGDELKDSPVNRNGPLRGQTVYMDVERALALAEGGLDTLVAKDSLESYAARLQRGAAERATSGGTVNLRSQGETIVESGATIDVSGGSVDYRPGMVKQSVLISNGKLVDATEATAGTRYDGDASRFRVDHDRWNRTDVIETGAAQRHDAGYVLGKDAGRVNVVGMKATVMQGDVVGRTVQGTLQQASGSAPAGATLRLGSNAVGDDFKLNQRVLIERGLAGLQTGFGFGDVLGQPFNETLVIDPRLLGKDRVARLEVFGNNEVVIRSDLAMEPGGSLSVTGQRVQVDANLSARGGRIELNAANNVVNTGAPAPRLDVAAGRTIDVSGGFTHLNPRLAQANAPTVPVNGGQIVMDSDGVLSLGAGSVLRADGGARIDAKGKTTLGDGGAIELSGATGLSLGGELSALGGDQGGRLTLGAPAVVVGGSGAGLPADATHLAADFFSQGGFEQVNVRGDRSVDIVAGTVLQPLLTTHALAPDAGTASTGAPLAQVLQNEVRPPLERRAVNLAFSAPATLDGTAGTVTLGEGARILAEPGANVSFSARAQVQLLGEVQAQGGTISASVNRAAADPFRADAAVWLGEHARLDASGVVRTEVDDQGLVRAQVKDGGTVQLQGTNAYVVAQAGSVIDVSGSAATRVDHAGAAEGLGQSVSASAGTLRVGTTEGALLDGTVHAQARAADARGADFVFALTATDATARAAAGAPLTPRQLTVEQTLDPQSAGLAPGAALDNAHNGNVRLSATALREAGFDAIDLSSADRIALADGAQLQAAAGARELRFVRLDSAQLQAQGAGAQVRAHEVLLSNSPNATVAAPSGGPATLDVQAELLRVQGRVTVAGADQVRLTGRQEIRLEGASSSQRQGSLTVGGNLELHAGVVAPGTDAQFTIDVPQGDVRIHAVGVEPSMPLSAQGSLTVKAGDITQAGRVWAPMGAIDLQASGVLELQSGSLTSVHAEGLVPYGRIENGRTWVYGAGQGRRIDHLDGKRIRTEGASVDVQAGARVDLRGGGDLQADEFTVGPGGSLDFLAQDGVYAVLPAQAAGFAPGDAALDGRLERSGAIELRGVPGLADGRYVLLPGRYALLPGAFAVRLSDSAAALLPSQAHTRADGVRVAAGFVTDTRAQAPTPGQWSAVEVFSAEQVRDRAEYTVTRAADFFGAGAVQAADAGRLSMVTQGTGADALRLQGQFLTAAASGGRGAAVDLSADRIEVVGAGLAPATSGATVIAAQDLNALGAASILIGGERRTEGDKDVITVGAREVTLTNNEASALRASEVILAGSERVELAEGSRLQAQGPAGSGRAFSVAGNGALVRAGVDAVAYERTGAPDRSTGTIVGAASSRIDAPAIVLDATADNRFQGELGFGGATGGRLEIGASRISLGEVPTGTGGVVYDNADLARFDTLDALALRSYSSIDLYGDTQLGAQGADGKATLGRLDLRAAAISGRDNAQATVRAGTVSFANAAGATATPASTAPGSALTVHAERLELGEGAKRIDGFDTVALNAGTLAGVGTGSLTVAASTTTVATGALVGTEASNQTLNASGRLAVARLAGADAAAAASALGSRWQLEGESLDFGARAVLPSGELGLTSRSGELRVGATAEIDAGGRHVSYFDAQRATDGGRVSLRSQGSGGIVVEQGARIGVSAVAGGDAGRIEIRTPGGTLDLAAGSLQGQAGPGGGEGARISVDVGRVADFSALAAAVGQGGFTQEQAYRVRTGDLELQSGQTVRAQEIAIAADGGDIRVAGALDASGAKGGRVSVQAQGDLTLASGARISVRATDAAQNGGTVELGSSDGVLDLQQGSTIAAQGARGGEVQLRARRTGSGASEDVAVTQVASTFDGVDQIRLEAVKVHENINRLTATGNVAGELSLATVNADLNNFAARHGAIESRLGQAADARFQVVSGVEVRSQGDLTLANDWNLDGSHAGGQPGVLTLRAAGNVKLDNHLSDGFSTATPCATPTCAATSPVPATLRGQDSWNLNVTAGADLGAVSRHATVDGTGDVTLAAGKLLRTGTGDIRVHAGRDVVLASAESAIYTAGKLATPVAGFAVPANAQFSEQGGDVVIEAGRDIQSLARSQQLYSNWLFRQGQTNTTGDSYTTAPGWWVRFDRFQQGVAALGGGDVTLRAGNDVRNLSASAPTQARSTGTTPATNRLVVTGGGAVRVEAGGDIQGGQYQADRGALRLDAGGNIEAGERVTVGTGSRALFPILAMGDTQAKVTARGDVGIHAVINPHLVVQSSGNGTGVNVGNSASPQWSLFSTYSDGAALQMGSLTGDVVFHNRPGGSSELASLTTTNQTYRAPLNFSISAANYNAAIALGVLPPSLEITAPQGRAVVDGVSSTLQPSAAGQLALLARDEVNVAASLNLGDMAPLPDALHPVTRSSAFATTTATAHAPVPVHQGSDSPALLHASEGDVVGQSGRLNLASAKPVSVKAGRDVRNLGLSIQHNDADDVSVVQAGRDVVFSSTGTSRTPGSYVWVAGPGRLEVRAGRDVDLGTSAGIVSRGNLDNPALPSQGADLHIYAGIGDAAWKETDVIGRLLTQLGRAPGDLGALWAARWLTGNPGLDAANAADAVRALQAQPADAQRERVRTMVYTALRETGRDYNQRESAFAGDYSRGYAVLDLAFPGMAERTPQGGFARYQGSLNLFASRLLTEAGGDVEFMVPGGDVVVGLANTPADLLATQKPGSGIGLTDSGVLGVAVIGEGSVRGFARGDMLVNQSRILTVGGGDVMLWSSEGDIDAGKGKKTASVVPPPLILIDAQGNVTQVLQGAATGSGIGALSTGGARAGDVDLVAPKGTVNAGDAGIRAGNLNIAAQVVLGADNISASGTSTGTPVADTSAVTAASSGATSGGDDASRVVEALNQAAADSAKAAQELAAALRPSVVRVDVLGFGNE
jgi:filamentous hemagglutinin